jgi:general secretion pathway protein H
MSARRTALGFAPRAISGFTLLELLMVMAIMAFIATLVVVQVVGRLDSVKIANAGKDIAAAMRYTRGQAMLTQEAQAVLFDMEKKSYTAPGKEAVTLPKEMDILLYTADSEIASAKSGSIRFYPDGGSTGGAVTLKSNGREWKVLVGWLTGDISFEDLARKRQQTKTPRARTQPRGNP